MPSLVAQACCAWCARFALLGLLVTSAFGASISPVSALERWFWEALTFCQLAFYVLAWCGARAGRLGSLARTFVVLNAAPGGRTVAVSCGGHSKLLVAAATRP